MKLKILAAWAVGCAVGAGSAVVVLVGGCGIGKASASTVATVPCDATTLEATYDLPDSDPETLASVAALQTGPNLGFKSSLGVTAIPAAVEHFRGAKVTVRCSAGNSIMFAQR